MKLTPEYSDLFLEMLSIPALSREEKLRVDFMEQFLRGKGWSLVRIENNLIVTAGSDPANARLMLNSHLDTVSPTEGWNSDPFKPNLEDGYITALGSNDAGASVLSLTAAFEAVITEDPKAEIVLVLSAEEEVSGVNGIERVLPLLKKVEFAIVGEPTEMQPAVAQRGLMVIDAEAKGESGHAARNEGINAIYRAMEDIGKIRNLSFEKQSEWLEAPTITVTMIDAGKNHNVVPSRCNFVVDVRSNDLYSNEFLLKLLKENVGSELNPRSTRLHSTALPSTHKAFGIFEKTGRTPFGSSTLSDMALMPFPAVKIGPGSSTRSHTANEFILEREIADSIGLYRQIIQLYLN